MHVRVSMCALACVLTLLRRTEGASVTVWSNILPQSLHFENAEPAWTSVILPPPSLYRLVVTEPYLLAGLLSYVDMFGKQRPMSPGIFVSVQEGKYEPAKK